MNKTTDIYTTFKKRKGQIAILIDPEEIDNKEKLIQLIEKAEFAKVDYFFVGGSSVTREKFEDVITLLKSKTKTPVVIFPGSSHQVSKQADAILYLSLISGRNPEFLIGQHVQSANEIYDLNIEVIPTAYLLIDGGTKSSVAYVSQTTPIPQDKDRIILNTAKAGLLQGKQLLFLDGGSGAKHHVRPSIIDKLSELNHPIIVGGGIRSISTIKKLEKANVLVIGNKIEEEIDFLLDIHSYTSARE